MGTFARIGARYFYLNPFIQSLLRHFDASPARRRALLISPINFVRGGYISPCHRIFECNLLSSNLLGSLSAFVRRASAPRCTRPVESPVEMAAGRLVRQCRGVDGRYRSADKPPVAQVECCQSERQRSAMTNPDILLPPISPPRCTSTKVRPQAIASKPRAFPDFTYLR